MRWIAFLCLLITFDAQAQLWKDYKLNANNDTLNRIDQKDRKQGPWVHRYESVRGEPGYEEGRLVQIQSQRRGMAALQSRRRPS